MHVLMHMYAHIYGSQKSALGLVVTQTLSSLMFLGLLLAWISLVRARLAVTCRLFLLLCLVSKVHGLCEEGLIFLAPDLVIVFS